MPNFETIEEILDLKRGLTNNTESIEDDEAQPPVSVDTSPTRPTPETLRRDLICLGLEPTSGRSAKPKEIFPNTQSSLKKLINRITGK